MALPAQSSSLNLTPGEQWRLWGGRTAGLLAAVLIYLVLPLPHSARAAAAVAALMALWWMTEALPLPITSLLPLILFPLLDISPLAEAAQPYANKFIFLYMGGFMLALAIEKWGLHRRLALSIVLAVGGGPARLAAGFMAASGLLSMWISNTAATLMMLPIAVSVAGLLSSKNSRQQAEPAAQSHQPQHNLGPCLLLGVAYSASAGGLATLVGTPPNAVLAGFLKQQGVTISFAQWMALGLPLSLLMLLLIWLLLTQFLFPLQNVQLGGAREELHKQLRELGGLSRGETIVLAVFAATALAWMFRDLLAGWLPVLKKVDDSMIALCSALLLFLIPVNIRRGEFALDWQTAVKLPWGVLLLFGGGLSLAAAVESSGLADAISGQLGALQGFSPWLLALVVTATIIFLTEITSNTATATIFIPVLFAAAGGLVSADGSPVSPLLLLLPATLAASCAFMLPVATPPNAIVFGSGQITIGQMARAGWLLNLLSIGLILAVVRLLGPWVFGL